MVKSVRIGIVFLILTNYEFFDHTVREVIPPTHACNAYGRWKQELTPDLAFLVDSGYCWCRLFSETLFAFDVLLSFFQAHEIDVSLVGVGCSALLMRSGMWRAQSFGREGGLFAVC